MLSFYKQFVLLLATGFGFVAVSIFSSASDSDFNSGPAALSQQQQATTQTEATTQSEPATQTETATPPTEDSRQHEDLDAILWVQTSAEYRAITRQTFRAARAALGDALVDPMWTACPEQQEMLKKNDSAKWFRALPTAVIVDVDETVLDNSAYQVGLIEEDSEYSREGWKAFVETKVSTPIPGAVEFVNSCRAAGVTVLFVTNREHDIEGSTRSNLIACGLMTEDDPDNVFSKNEQEDWTSDKSTRRAKLAESYRILLQVGDDLNDFLATDYHAASELRRSAADEYESWWGERWFVLPNPNYGGWEQSLYDWENAVSAETKRKRKRKAMVR